MLLLKKPKVWVGLEKESKYAQSRPPSELLVENAKVMIDSSNAMHKMK
jgi:hypothetical protein